jgi:predicted site-specific integrase-resolvase
VAYARVSSHDQKDDLQRQKQVLELYCARRGWVFDVMADLGSGMNDHKKGHQRMKSGGSSLQRPAAALWRGTHFRDL